MSDPLKAIRDLRRRVLIGISVAIAIVLALDYLVLGYTLSQLGIAAGISFSIVVAVMKGAFAQAFKLRKRSAYPGIVLADLGRSHSVDTAAQDALAVLHRLLGLNCSFIALQDGESDLRVVSVSGMSPDAAGHLLITGESDFQEAVRTQQPVTFERPRPEGSEFVLGPDERLVFISVVGLQQPLGMLAVVGGKGNGDLKDHELLSGIGTALGISLENLRQKEGLRHREQEFRTLAENAPDIIARFDRELRHVYVNPAVERVLGLPPAEIIGKSHAELGMPQEPYSQWGASLKAVFETGQEADIEFTTPSGAHHYQSRLVPEFAEDGSLDYVLTITRDITEIKRAQEALRESETKFRTLAETMAAATFIFQGTKMRYVNSAAEVVSGYSREELVKMNFWDMIHPDSQELVKERGMARQRGEPVPQRYEVKLLTKGGEERWVDFTAGAVEFEGKPAVLGTAFDITERRRAEETIRHLAYHDALTGLPNRTLFEDRLTVTLAQARRKRRTAAIMFLDLDRFKVVNDTVGHALGDRLLQGVAQRLTGLVREGDTVARVGGDEFTLLLPEIGQVEDAVEVAERILETLRRPWLLHDHEFHISTSIGIAMCPADGDDAESLLRNADTAMYRAKDQGRDNYKLYTATMNARIAERLALENDLRRALKRDELVIHYQPQVDVKTGQIVGAEALVRWQHPERGLLPPGEFIPFAEETGLVLPLEERVIRIACSQARAWQDAGFPVGRMAVNMSARHLHRTAVTETISRLLKESGLAPHHLALEITESAVVENLENAVEVLRDLREMGVAIAIDDFGTGYSSLSYLKRLPIDAVKIDQSFVRDLGTDPSDAAIVTTVVEMAHNLGLNVIAEGVETEEQLAFLKDRRCDEMQGFLFSKPVPAEAFERMMKREARRSRAKASVGSR